VLSGPTMFVNIGSPSNSCQVANRQLHSPGVLPCRELDTRAGIWAFDASTTGQTLSCGTRVATGMRNTNAMALEPGNSMLWGAINGRDQLHENWPELFTEDDDKRLPSDEVVAVTKNLDRGWPYCYHDAGAKQMKLAPEYGGDGEKRGRCASVDQPQFANSIKPSAEVTSPIGYVRLHGRNYQNWFREEANVLERYDYLYSNDELDPWVERIKQVADKARQTFVITNNHARGQSLVNAFEILAQLEEARVPGPAKLVETYPRLVESVEPDDDEPQGSLF